MKVTVQKFNISFLATQSGMETSLYVKVSVCFNSVQIFIIIFLNKQRIKHIFRDCLSAKTTKITKGFCQIIYKPNFKLSFYIDQLSLFREFSSSFKKFENMTRARSCCTSLDPKSVTTSFKLDFTLSGLQTRVCSPTCGNSNETWLETVPTGKCFTVLGWITVFLGFPVLLPKSRENMRF